jgi:hypothetical protein
MNRTPLILAVVLLLLPLLYLGSYFALVVPGGRVEVRQVPAMAMVSGKPQRQLVFETEVRHYRAGSAWCERIFWPLEQIDRKLRRGTWEASWDEPALFGY